MMRSEFTPNPKVLIVEDDAFILGMYVKKLQHEQCATLVATDGERGLETARVERPDIILLDILLPRMDGLFVLEQLKRDPATRDIPVIILSNLNDEKVIEKGYALGAAAFVVKAHNEPAEVVEKVKRVISEQRTLRAMR